MKKKILFAVAGLFLLVPIATLAQWDVSNPDYTNSGLPSSPIYSITKNVMNWILAIFGFIGVIGFAISGIMYLTSTGEEKTTEKAKLAMKWSIVGIAVGLAGFVIIKAIDSALKATSSF
jgi:hypothetical protein